jgi:2,4-dienoyl-CoA reductase-like NADH-dependent reductase (Old Yellow Enzyme family)
MDIDRTAHLFAPLRIRDVQLRNRIAVSPMCEYSSQEGFANDWHMVHLGSRAVGGAGLVLTEAAAVLPAGRITPDDLGIWSDTHVEMLARIFHFVESQGAVPGMQLAHAGRKASTSAPWKGGLPIGESDGGWRPIAAPSPVPFDEGYQVPEPLDADGIRAIVQAFAQAAQRCLEAGAKVIEIHAAHGYLLHEFLSPLSNHRPDSYGGAFENRSRVLCEVIEAVRKVWPERLPLFVRISATDWTEGGWTGEDSVALARKVRPLGVDLIDCSSGGNVARAQIPVGPGYQVPYAARVKEEAGIPTAAVGMITAAEQADQIIRNQHADLVFLARELLRDPYWPHHAAKTLRQKFPVPPQYLRAL